LSQKGKSKNWKRCLRFITKQCRMERTSGATRLPWLKETPAGAVGVFARDHGRTLPGRMIESAKSWLCHNGVDRKAALLPWHGAADVERSSPVEATARYLRHMKDAWDASHHDHPMAEQDIVLTIPASFDEVARELTVAAARMAGLPRIVLLEEPQAAFYSWVDAHRDDWDQIVSPGQTILVCDIGGGTSDFSLIHVRSGEGGRLQFHRVAVGDHLLLGGDNLDLALAHFVEQKLTNGGQA
jgi:molecular chaperone DnaK (HSP70)